MKTRYGIPYKGSKNKIGLKFDRETGTRTYYEGKSLGEIEYALEKQEEVMVKWRIFP